MTLKPSFGSSISRLIPRRGYKLDFRRRADGVGPVLITSGSCRANVRERVRQRVRVLVRWICRPWVLVSVLLFLLVLPFALFAASGGFRETAPMLARGLEERQRFGDSRRLVDQQQVALYARPNQLPSMARKSPQTAPTAAVADDQLPETALVEKVTPKCVRSPLWEKRVDTSQYTFGCREIEEMMQGEKELIGNGNVRDVYRIEYKGRQLVVKTLRDDFELKASKARVEKIHRWEAAALDAVRGHPNVVGLLGICGSTSVSEHFSLRLDDLVLKPGGAEHLPMSRVLSMSLDAARGLQALHEAPGGAIVHFDIKPQQMMLDVEGTLKINDLNMCRFTDLDDTGNVCPFEASASRPGPWRSPENIAGEALSEKLDVYSLAMVFYSMLAHKPPFVGEPESQKKILNGIPPAVDPSWDSGFMEIVQDMWRRDPMMRPSARQVAMSLEALIENREKEATPKPTTYLRSSLLRGR